MAPHDTEALLDRVCKLLALATSPNVHEAAAAASRAQALIEAHRLEALLDAERAEAADPVSDGAEAPLESTKRLRKWKVVLAQGLARANGCQAYTRKLGPREKALCIAGRDADRQAVAALWDWLVKQIEWASATEGPDQGRAWHEGFRVGAAEEVGRRLAEGRETGRATLDAAALARVEPALQVRREAVERFARERLGLKKGRAIRVDARAYREGRRVGASLPLGGPAEDG